VSHPEIVLVLARADNGVIGDRGGIPWRIPADMRRFKTITMGTPMIMGRKTFESLPGILPGRRHIVLTRDADWQHDEAQGATTMAEALQAANAPHISVIGGADIYRLFLPVADRIELTEVHVAPEGDTVMAPFDPEIWQETARDSHPAADGRPAYSFVTLRRRG
jgi:dihydrofolate reductase